MVQTFPGRLHLSYAGGSFSALREHFIKKQSTVGGGVLVKQLFWVPSDRLSAGRAAVPERTRTTQGAQLSVRSATSILTCFCLIDLEGSAAQVGTVECFNGFVAVFISDFNEAETAGAAGFSIEDDTSALNGAKLTEEVGEFLVTSREGEVAHVDIHRVT